MPRTVSIEPSSGKADISYMICTPDLENAESIDPLLPTVVLLHSIYASQMIFHYQFSSPEMRRFNLVAFDMRSHGDTISNVPPHFRQAHAAEDVCHAMEKLKLPRCHFFGVSLGSVIAQEVAISYPDKVLSLFLVSPVPPDEAEETTRVRKQIYGYWKADFENPLAINENSGMDAVTGALQLGFGFDNASSILKASSVYSVKRGKKIWCAARLNEFYTMTVTFWEDRPAHPISSLQKIRCPVHLIQCTEDLVCAPDSVDALRDQLQEAGVNVKLTPIAAPHCAVASHPELVNELFLKWILEQVDNAAIPPAKASATSPYEEELVSYGLNDRPEGEDLDDDDLVLITYK